MEQARRILSDITKDFSDGSRFGGRKSKGRLVDLNTGILRRDHVLVQRTPGVEIFIGFGPMAGRLLNFAFESGSEPDPFFAKCDAIDEALRADGPTIVDCVVAANELPNFPHVELEQAGNFAKAKIKEAILAVTGG